MTEFDFRDSGFINYDALANIERELREQYAVQEAEGKAYKRPEDLDTIFRGQAAKLAGQGVESIYDLTPTIYERDGRVITNLLNKRTGDVLREARLTEGWQEDPTAITFKKTQNVEGQVVNQPIELKDRNGYQQWGADTSVSDMARYGINFVDGTPVFAPVYKDTTNFTTSDALKTAAAIAAAYYGGQYLLGGETAAAGAGTAGTAGASTGAGSSISLLEGAQFPVEGLKAAVSTAPSATAPFATSTAATGFQASAIPGLSAMGGAQGLTVPVAGGTITGGGLIPAGAPIPLGGGSELSLLDAARGLNTLRNLTFKPPEPGQQQPITRPQSQFSLPAPQQTVVGLLPLAERYRRSLI